MLLLIVISCLILTIICLGVLLRGAHSDRRLSDKLEDISFALNEKQVKRIFAAEKIERDFQSRMNELFSEQERIDLRLDQVESYLKEKNKRRRDSNGRFS